MLNSVDRPLNETIGLYGGSASDGVLLGKITLKKPNKFFFRTAILSNGRVFVADDSGSGVSFLDVSTSANNAAVNDTPLFPASPTVGDRVIFALPVTQAVSGHDIVLSTAGSGLTYAIDYWNTTTNAWSALTSTLSAGFLQSIGAHSITFTAPADMGGRPFDLVGGGTFFGKAISIRIVTVASPVVPVASQVIPLGTEFSNLDLSTFYDNLHTTQTNVYAAKDTEQCFVTTDKPFGFELIYETAETNTTFVFGAPNPGTGIFEAFAEFSDTSTSFTAANSVTHTPYRLTASAANAVAASVQALTKSGYIESRVAAVPTATTGRTIIGLDDAATGNIKYELRNTFVSGNPRIQVYEDNVLMYTHTVNTAMNDKLRVMRFEGQVVYSLNGRTIYQSTTASTGNLLARFGATDNAAIVGGIRLVNFSTSKANIVALTYQSSTNFTASTEASTTEQLLAKHYVRFVPPANFVSLTADQSPVGVAGYHYCIKHNTAGIPVVQTMLGRVLPLTGANAVGDFMTDGASFKHVTLGFNDGSALATESKLLVSNTSSGSFAKVTIPAGTSHHEENITMNYSNGQGLMVIQITGDNESDIGFSSYISITG